MSKRLAVVVALGAVSAALVCGCAAGGTDGAAGAGSPAPGSTITSAPSGGTVSDSTPGRGNPSPGPLPGEVTLTGDVVFVEIEGGCLALQADGKKYELMGGDRSLLTAGAHVQIRGRVRTDVATICQIGPVLEVLEARPA